MSKIAVVFDVHAWPHKRHGGPLVKGINRRGALCLDVLQRAIDVANANDAPLVVAGDLIDSAGPVQPQFAAMLRDTLAKCKRPVTLLLGNHDMTANGDHSLGIYEQQSDWHCTQVCSEIAEPCGNWLDTSVLILDEMCLVPFHCDIRDERVRDVPLLVAHFGVYDDSFSPWCKRAKGAWHVDALFDFMKERNIKCCLLGDWHSRNTWIDGRSGIKRINWSNPDKPVGPIECEKVRIILQGGALVPTGWDNQGLHGYGTVALWDTDEHRLSWQELPGPRFCTARSDEEEASIIAEAQRLGHALFLRRYYSGDRPATPQGVEAYEALPLKIETAAKNLIALNNGPKEQLEALILHWLDEFNDDRDALEAHARRYL